MNESDRKAAGYLEQLGRRASDKKGQSEGESLDVLLQLTLPIVLILALYMVIEIQQLETALDETRSELSQTQSELKETQSELQSKSAQLEYERSLDLEKDEALQHEDLIIALQEKLLREATEEVADIEAERLSIESYPDVAPNIYVLAAALT